MLTLSIWLAILHSGLSACSSSLWHQMQRMKTVREQHATEGDGCSIYALAPLSCISPQYTFSCNKNAETFMKLSL